MKIDSETFPISSVKLEYGGKRCSSETSFRSIKESVLSPRKATEKEHIKDRKRRDVPNITSFSESSFPSTSEIKSCENEKLSPILTIKELHPASSVRSPPPPKAPHSSPVWRQPWPGLYGRGIVLKDDTSEDSHEHYERVCEKLLKRDYLEYDFLCGRWKESESEDLMVSETYNEEGKKTPSRKKDKNVGKELGGVGLDRPDVVSFSTATLADCSKHLALHQKSRIGFADHHRRISSDTDGIANAFTSTMPRSTPIEGKKLNNGVDFDVNMNNGSTRDVDTCNLFFSANASEYPMNGRYLLEKPSSEWEQASLEHEVPCSSSTLLERSNLDTKVSEQSLFGNTFQESPKISPNPFVLASKQCLRSKSTNSADFGSSQREGELKGATSKNDTKTVRSFFNANKHFLRMRRSSQESRDERLELLDSSICNVKGRRSNQDNPNQGSVRLLLPQQVTKGRATVNTVQQSADRKKVMENHNKEHNRDTRDSSSKEFNVVRKPSFGIPWNTLATKSDKALQRAPLQMNNLSPRSSSASIFSTSEMKSGQLETVFGDGTREYGFWVDKSEQFSTKIQCKDLYQIGSSSDQVFTIFSLKGKQASKWKNWGQRKPAPIPVANMKFKASMHISDVHENGEHCVRAEYVLYTPQEGDNVISANLDPKLNLLTSRDRLGIESPRHYPLPLKCPSSPKRVMPASDSPASSELTTNPKPNQLARRRHRWSFAGSKLHEFSTGGFTKGSNAERLLPLKLSEELASIVIEVPPKNEKHFYNFGDELISGRKFSCTTSFPTHRRAHSSFVPKFLHTAAKDIQDLMHKGLRSSPAASKANYRVLRRSGSTKESTIYRLNHTEVIQHNNLTIPVSERSPQWDKCFRNQIDFKAQHQYTSTNIEGDSVTIILPAGEHGHPKYGLYRPQPLIDRWRSGGKCDCGNWDLGCGLVILDNQLEKCSSLAGNWQHSGDHSNQNNLLECYIQGRRTNIPALVLTPRHEGQFLLQFQATISPLQAFAIALAILHSNLELARCLSRAGRMENINAELMNKLLCNSEVCESALPGSRSEVLIDWPKFLRNVSFSQGHHLDPPFYPIERV